MVYVKNEEPTPMSMSTFQPWAPGMFRQCWELGNITRSNAPLLSSCSQETQEPQTLTTGWLWPFLFQGQLFTIQAL